MRERRGKISFVVSCKEWQGKVEEIDSKIKYVKGKKKRENFERGTENVFGLQRAGCLQIFPGEIKNGWDVPFNSPLSVSLVYYDEASACSSLQMRKQTSQLFLLLSAVVSVQILLLIFFISPLFHFPLSLSGKYNPQQPKYLGGKKINKYCSCPP